MRDFKQAVTNARNEQSHGPTGLQKLAMAEMVEPADTALHAPAAAASVDSTASLGMLTEIRDLLLCMRSDYRRVHSLGDE
jgi:hypothetical protein